MKAIFWHRRDLRIPGRDEARLKRAVAEYISAAATHWRSQAESVLISRGDDIQTDTDFILNSLDWAVVNAAAMATPAGVTAHEYV